MNVTLWILQGVLGVAFAGAGLMKLALDKKVLADKGMGFVDEVSPGFVKALGAAELLGAIGVVLPAIVNIAPILVPVAATCLAIVMVGAIVVHIRRAEHAAILAPAVLFVMAAVVAWGRFGPYAFSIV
jgi:DoxX-like family